MNAVQPRSRPIRAAREVGCTLEGLRPTRPAPAEPRVAVEMTFRHVQALEELVEHVRLCARSLETVVPEHCQCSVSVQPRWAHGVRRGFEIEARVVGPDLYKAAHQRGRDPFQAITWAFGALRQQVTQELRSLGHPRRVRHR